jgi:4-hydroxymandelate oxidase
MRSVDRSTRQAPPVNLADFEAPARALLPRSSYDYFAGGAEDEATVAANREAFARWRFRYRTLAGAASPQLGGQLLGDPVAMPVHLAPTATQKLAHPDGELAAARAAASAGVVYCLSTLSTTSMEEVAKAGGNCWFQLYIYKDRGITRSLVNRAESCGFRAIVVTVDAPVLGRRERDLRNGFSLPGDLRYENLVDALSHTEDAGPGHSGLAGYFNAQLDPSLTWKDLEWICGLARVPVLAKGLVRSDDAQKALDSGARGGDRQQPRRTPARPFGG